MGFRGSCDDNDARDEINSAMTELVKDALETEPIEVHSEDIEIEFDNNK